jgi:hypothetical protein
MESAVESHVEWCLRYISETGHHFTHEPSRGKYCYWVRSNDNPTRLLFELDDTGKQLLQTVLKPAFWSGFVVDGNFLISNFNRDVRFCLDYWREHGHLDLTFDDDFESEWCCEEMGEYEDREDLPYDWSYCPFCGEYL